MKNRYDLLNDTKVDIGEYQVKPLTDLEKASMKRNFHRTITPSWKKVQARWVAVAACMVCVVCFSQTAFAQAIINGILQTISLGHNSVVQLDTSKKEISSQQFFDKDGKPITKMGENTTIYDANGKKLGTASAGKKGTSEVGCIIEKDLNKAVSQLIFKPLLPKALPKNYVFDHAALFPDEKGKVSGDYLNFTYKSSGSSITVSQRRITSGTTYTFATDGAVGKLKVNWHDAALVDGHSLEWEADGVSISVSGKVLTSDELLTFAESFA